MAATFDVDIETTATLDGLRPVKLIVNKGHRSFCLELILKDGDDQKVIVLTKQEVMAIAQTLIAFGNAI